MKPKQPNVVKTSVAESSHAQVGDDDDTANIEDIYFEGDDLIALRNGRAVTRSKEEQEGHMTSNVTGAGVGTKGTIDTKENQKGLFINDDLIAFE